MSEPALSCEDLSKSFGGIRSVDRVSFQLAVGEHRVLIGPNGAGKTTLFNLISGQLQPDGGRIQLYGRPLTGLPVYRRARLGLARTFQISNVLSHLSVEENVLLSCLARSCARRCFWRPATSYAREREQVLRLLEAWGLAEERGRQARSLSYGQQRRLEIVMALANQPRILLLDEPAAGLSTAEARRLVETIQRLPPDLSLLMIEHDMAVAFEAAHSLMVMAQGTIFASGSPEVLRRDPRLLELYLGSAHEKTSNL